MTSPAQEKGHPPPAEIGWPADVLPILEQGVTCEYASLTRKGLPLTYPVTPYLSDDHTTIDVSTGLAYTSKAERARHNPKVALLFSDPTGSGLTRPPVVLIQGYGAVRDANLQVNTDRYVAAGMRKFPEAYQGMPPFMLRRMAWYFARIWIEVTPRRILWWPEGDTERSPEEWAANPALPIPASDPPPSGKALKPWMETAADWRPAAEYGVRELGAPVLTTVGDDGFPLPCRVRNATLSTDGVRFELPRGLPEVRPGAACLTFHRHPEVFTGQENIVFVGQVSTNGGDGHFVIERQIGSWEIKGARWRQALDLFMKGRKLAPRLKEEAARRGQPVPVVRLPGAR